MAGTFYWYDLETSGIAPKWDRIVQFAGLRTDEDLNPVGEEFSTYVQLPDDVLPSPEASLVTGITPQLTHRKGISETAALLRINEIFSQPGTCVAGYNSLRFDDEFMRYSLYRNLMDPYAREYQNGNSRWDLIDLVRATGGLRREGINWPQDENGLPVYRLEELTRMNGIDHGQAHDAMSDVHATVGLAKLIKEKQPKLFDYYFSLRHKKQVRALLEPYGARLCVHVSGMYPRDRFGVAPVISLNRHPTNGNSVVVVDLAQDVDDILTLPAAELAERLFTPGSENRPGIKEIRINRCPFVAPIEVLTEENIAHLNIDMKAVRERARRLTQPAVTQKIAQIFTQSHPAPATDPDAALYDGFLQDEDRSRCQHLHAELAAGRWADMDFKDKRLTRLAGRMKGHSFPNLLDEAELPHWRNFVAGKLTGEGDWLNLEKFEANINARLAEGVDDESAYEVLQSLSLHAQDLKQRYQL